MLPVCCHCPNGVVVGRPTVTPAVSHADTAPDAACTGLAGRTHEAVALCEGPRSRSSRRSSCSTVTAIQSELALPPALGQSMSLHVRAGSTRAAVTRAASVPSTDVHMPDRFWAVVGASPSFGVLIKVKLRRIMHINPRIRIRFLRSSPSTTPRPPNINGQHVAQSSSQRVMLGGGARYGGRLERARVADVSCLILIRGLIRTVHIA